MLSLSSFVIHVLQILFPSLAVLLFAFAILSLSLSLLHSAGWNNAARYEVFDLILEFIMFPQLLITLHLEV